MDFATYAILLAGALAGGFVSGLAGFGTALMALGIWLYIVPPAVAGAPTGTTQINDVFVDEREVVYCVDRHLGGLYCLEMDF